MKKSVKIAAAVILFLAAGAFYLRSQDGKEILEKTEAAEVTEALEDAGEGTEENVLNGETALTETEMAGFSDRQKQELIEIISTCMEDNLNALMEDGRLPAGVASYQEYYSGLININTADAEELTKLNGIGPAKAAAIVQYRDEHGAFGSLEELTGVPGISGGTLEKLRDQATL